MELKIKLNLNRSIKLTPSSPPVQDDEIGQSDNRKQTLYFTFIIERGETLNSIERLI